MREWRKGNEWMMWMMERGVEVRKWRLKQRQGQRQVKVRLKSDTEVDNK